MENQIPPVPEVLPGENPSTVQVKEKLTFQERFLKFSQKHNRINRIGFFTNIFAIGIIFWFLEGVPGFATVINLIFLYLVIIQIIKRSHDFGRRGIIASIIFVFFPLGIAILPLFLFPSPLEYTLFLFGHPYLSIFLGLLPIAPLLVVGLIPGDKEINQYGERFGL